MKKVIDTPQRIPHPLDPDQERAYCTLFEEIKKGNILGDEGLREELIVTNLIPARNSEGEVSKDGSSFFTLRKKNDEAIYTHYMGGRSEGYPELWIYAISKEFPMDKTHPKYSEKMKFLEKTLRRAE